MTEATSHEPDFWSGLRASAASRGDAAYADFVTKLPEVAYRERIARLGFEDMSDVLDLGCGFGHWSWALSARNAHVVALEINEDRLAVAREFLAEKGRENVSFVHASGAHIPFPDESFDAVFCYGVLMFLPLAAARAELLRVLRPGGLLYLCVNGPGWWLKLALKSWRTRAVRASALGALRNGTGGAVPSSIRISDLSKVFPAPDWKVMAADREGRIGGGSNLSAYDGPFVGLDNVIECVIRKNDRHSSPKSPRIKGRNAIDPESFLNETLRSTLSRSNYSYRHAVLDHFQPRPVKDITFNSDVERIDRIHDALSGLDRPRSLATIYQRLTEGADTAEQRTLSVLRFAQLHFNHHFAGQPIRADGTLVSDPLELLALRSARCGSVARFVIDVLEAGGIEGRLVAGSCHTSAEVFLSGEWRLADASLYPSGIAPRGHDGQLIRLNDAAGEPWRLDQPPSYINYEAGAVAETFRYYPELRGPIERYLHAPLLPSSGFFALEKAELGTDIRLTRFRKVRATSKPPGDRDYGWLDYAEEDTESYPSIRWVQRPSQVRDLKIVREHLTWAMDDPGIGGGSTVFTIHASAASRGWNYGAIPTACSFDLAPECARSSENSIPLSELPKDTRFVTVVARFAEMISDRCFFLPSDETGI